MIALEQAATKADVTYRQADHWKRQKYVHVRYFDNDGNEVEDTGYMSGFRAYLTTTEARVLTLMGRLVSAGIKPANAALYARRMVNDGANQCALDNGVTLTLKDAS